jgi:hypothetical protein
VGACKDCDATLAHENVQTWKIVSPAVPTAPEPRRPQAGAFEAGPDRPCGVIVSELASPNERKPAPSIAPGRADYGALDPVSGRRDVWRRR